jgi:hypothetical protein
VVHHVLPLEDHDGDGRVVRRNRQQKVLSTLQAERILHIVVFSVRLPVGASGTAAAGLSMDEEAELVCNGKKARATFYNTHLCLDDPEGSGCYVTLRRHHQRFPQPLHPRSQWRWRWQR